MLVQQKAQIGRWLMRRGQGQEHGTILPKRTLRMIEAAPSPQLFEDRCRQCIAAEVAALPRL